MPKASSPKRRPPEQTLEHQPQTEVTKLLCCDSVTLIHAKVDSIDALMYGKGGVLEDFVPFLNHKALVLSQAHLEDKKAS